MNTLVALEKMCKINAGLVLSRKEARTGDNVFKAYKALTLKSFEDGWINNEHLDDFSSQEEIDSRYLSEVGDIIIRLSSPYTAIHITDNFSGLVIPSLFAIIKVKDSSIDPKYLSFILNSETVKQSYLKNSMGTTIPVIRIQSLRLTEVPVPPHNKQLAIAKIGELMIKEKRLQNQIVLEKDKYNKELTKRIIKGGNTHAK